MADNNEKVFLTEQGVEDFTKALGAKFVWLSRLFDGNGKILPTLLPDFILGQVMFGGTIDANGIITPSNAYRNRYAGEFANGDVTLDVDSLAASTHEGVYFIASAKGASGVVEPTKLGVEVGDWVISNGQIWTKIDNTDAVKSVANLTGAISAEALRNATLADTANTMWYASAKGVLSSLTTTQYGRNLLSAESLTKVVGLFAEKAQKDANGNIITSTYMPFAGGTFTGCVTFEKDIHITPDKQIALFDENKELIGSIFAFNSTNKTFDLAYGAIREGNAYDTKIHGSNIYFLGKGGALAATINDQKDIIAEGNIRSKKGVSAKGIADFEISGNGGNGGAHYDLLIDQKSDKATFQLKGDDGDLDTKDLLAFSTSRAGIVPYAPSVGSVLRGNGWGTLAFSELASKPTTLDGYGITDALTKSQIENGIFPKMRVGLADDLGDIEETLEEEYTFQPTANPNEIRDGYAQIESLKGNSLVWNNQAKSLRAGVNFTILSEGNDMVVYYNGAASNSYFFVNASIKANHVYIVLFDLAMENSSDSLDMDFYFGGSPQYENRKKLVKGLNYFLYTASTDADFTAFDDGTPYIARAPFYIRKIRVIDLTQMFGKGYEPTTVEKFEKRCPKGMPMDYNEGEVIHFNGDAVKSVGFNQWDEEWEVGRWQDGKKFNFNNNVRSVNTFKVMSGATYYNSSDYRLYISFFDKNKQFVKGSGLDVGYIWQSKSTITIPDGVDSAAFFFENTTYNHDICINLSDPDKNGTYEPYTEFKRDLPTELFEGGMKSAGTAHDEIYFDKAKGKYIKVTRIGKVDLGTLEWGIQNKYQASGQKFVSKLTITDFGISNNKKNSFCAKYLYGNTNSEGSDKVYEFGTYLSIVDTSYTDVESFKAAMAGVMIYYELAEPIVEEIDIPYMDYQVSNSGTEEIVSGVPTTPIKARVTYNFDTVGTVKQNRFDISDIKATYQPLATAINTSNIGQQSVAKATADGDGNIIKYTYLSKVSGGTIEATGTRALTINRNNGNNSLIFFKGVVNGSTNDLGYLGFNGVNSPIFYSVEGNTSTLLHSGNTSLSVDDTKDGFTLNVNGNQVGMSAMTKERIEEIVNAALQD